MTSSGTHAREGGEMKRCGFRFPSPSGAREGTAVVVNSEDRGHEMVTPGWMVMMMTLLFSYD